MDTRIGLPGTSHGLVALLGISSEVARTAVLEGEGGPASRRVIVVILEHVAERRDSLFVRVTKPVADDLNIGAIGIHANRKPGSPDVPVVGCLSRSTQVIGGPVGSVAAVGPAHVESLA